MNHEVAVVKQNPPGIFVTFPAQHPYFRFGEFLLYLICNGPNLSLGVATTNQEVISKATQAPQVQDDQGSGLYLCRCLCCQLYQNFRIYPRFPLLSSLLIKAVLGHIGRNGIRDQKADAPALFHQLAYLMGRDIQGGNLY